MKHTIKSIILLAAIGLLSSCGKNIQETNPIRKYVTETVFASGNLEANQTYQLVAQSDGYLVELNFKENDILVMFQGKQNTGGYAIELQSIRWENQVLMIQKKEIFPEEGKAVKK